MISVVAITKNEEANIARCLESVKFADDIVVVDSGSTDRTKEIAASLGARVMHRDWEGYAKQKEFALHQAKHEWVFLIDADEEVTPELKDEMLRTIAQPDALNGYEVPRKSFFLGTFIRYGGWYPGYQRRLVRKSRTTMNHRPVHEGFLVEGPVGILKADLNHYTYGTIEQYIGKMNEYSSLDVHNTLKKRPAIRWYHFILNPLSVFLRMFVSLRGYKDGFHGFLLAYYSALHALVIFAKSWEYQSAERRGAERPPVTSEELSVLR